MENTSGSGSESQPITDQVKQGAQQVVEQGQQTATKVVHQVRNQATSMAESRKDQVSESITALAQALRQTGESLQTQQQGAMANLTHNSADRLESVASYLQTTTVDQLVHEAEGLARRNRGVFLGSTFALGLLAARFLKSSRPHQHETYSRNYGEGQYGENYGGGTYGGNYSSGMYGNAPYNTSDYSAGQYSGGSSYSGTDNYAGSGTHSGYTGVTSEYDAPAYGDYSVDTVETTEYTTEGSTSPVETGFGESDVTSRRSR